MISDRMIDQEIVKENRNTNSASVNESNDNIPQSLSPAMIAQVMEKGQGQPQQQSQKQIQSEYPQYDWDNKWLKGDEYANMLEKIEEYCKLYRLEKFTKKTHPEDIYRSPQNGLIYFVEGNCVGSEFGFPRVPFRKQYRWKKMNFTTDLPKKRPQVTYIVASSVKCQKSQGNDKQKQDNKKEQDVYRMHAVILYKNSQAKQQLQQQQTGTENNTNNGGNSNNNTPKGASNTGSNTSEGKQYILCHIRKMDINDEDRILTNRVGTNNNSSASESSQDLVANSNSQRSGKANKGIKNKKLSISENRAQFVDDEEDEDYESDIDEMDEVKENQRQNKRKSSSIYEKSSNIESQGNQVQTLHPHDTNKQSKAKSKLSNKQQNKQSENFQKLQYSQTPKQGAVAETNPEQPTDFLQMKTTNRGQSASQGSQQGSQINSILQENINKKTKLDDVFNQDQQQIINQLYNSIKGNSLQAQQLINSLQNVHQQHQSPNNQRQRSPGNCEVNSITSSSNTNQHKEEDVQQLQQQRIQQSIMGSIANPCIPTPTNITGGAPTGMNNIFSNQLFASAAGFPYQQGGMMMLQPYHQLQPAVNFQPFLQMYMNSQVYSDPIAIQQQQANYLSQVQQMPQTSNILSILKPQNVNMDVLNMYLQSTQNNTDFDYRNIYSMQMNNNMTTNSSYLPNQRNQNAP